MALALKVKEIRELAKTMKYKDIAKKYDVHEQLIYQVLAKKIWKHV